MQDKRKLRVAILTVSDRCFSGEAEDLSGASLTSLVDSCELFQGEVVTQHCVPDELPAITQILQKWCEAHDLDLVLTTGGTGISPRDVTPEAVKKVIEKEVVGMSLAMAGESLKVTPFAMLSRPVCGVKGNTLIVTLPGSVKAARECIRFVASAIPHAIDLIRDRKEHVAATHSDLESKDREVDRDKGDLGNGDGPVSKAMLPKLAHRPRRSPYPMIPVSGAEAIIFRAASPPVTFQLQTLEAMGFALAQDAHAQEPHPPFPASIKDGYAVLAADGAGSRTLIGQSCAGTRTRLPEIKPGTCLRVNTGATLPPGSNAVVQVEDTRVLREEDEGAEEVEIEILTIPSVGQEIRPKGSDIHKGQRLLTKGHVLNPAELSLLASAGITEVSVYRKPVTAVLSTGNELQAASDTPLREGHIYDSNKVALMALLKQHSFPSYNAGIALDDPTDLLRGIRRGLTHADILVTSGGVSMGDKDLLRLVLTSDLDATIHFARVFMKPGKPTAFATCVFEGKLKLILALPGNPVSALVTAHLFLLPLCRKMSGFTNYCNTIIKAKLATGIKLDPRPEYHRVNLEWSPDGSLPTAQSTGNQMSSYLMSMSSANALVCLPSSSKDTAHLPAGSEVEAILLGS